MKTILVLTDFSELADRAAKFALELAVTNQANVMLYHSIVLLEADATFVRNAVVADELVKKKKRSDDKLTELVAKLKSELHTDAPVEIYAQNGTGGVITAIQKLVAEQEVWLIVMGHHLSLKSKYRFSDSNIAEVCNNARCPVLLVP